MGCDRMFDDPLILDDLQDAVKVVCNNEGCRQGLWMHGDCFAVWEHHVLGYLRSCGRARSWSEKQRLQNLWTKKGYDLAYKACDCKCGKGHLRKDLDYIPPPVKNQPRKQRNNMKKIQPPTQQQQQQQQAQARALAALAKLPGPSPPQHPIAMPGGAQTARPQLRVRTNSIGSTGSSPPSSAGTPPLTPGGSSASSNGKKSKFDFFANQNQAAAGNIFKRRTDFFSFTCLPRHQQNPYHIKMEDEGPHGNDETRCFVLANLSSNMVTCVSCVMCARQMSVFDRYPLIDGTFFLSPQRYNTDLKVTAAECKSLAATATEARQLYLNAVCMQCMEGYSDMCCRACRQPWHGKTLLIGTMYSYDIFAANPCCGWRTACKRCHQPLVGHEKGFNYSEYSRPIECKQCHSRDHHFIKPLESTYFFKTQQSLFSASLCK